MIRSDMDVMKSTLQTVCSVNNMDFRNLVEQHGDVAWERINSSVDFVQSHPHYNRQRELGEANSAQDSFAEANMVVSVSVCRDIMREGPHVHNFCSTIHSGDWYN